MKIQIFTNNGSAVQHHYIKGLVETAEGKLVLFHADGKERYYDPSEWANGKFERSIIIDVEAEILADKLENA